MSGMKKLPKAEADKYHKDVIARCGYFGMKGLVKEVAMVCAETKRFGPKKALENSLVRRQENHFQCFGMSAYATVASLGFFATLQNPAIGYLALAAGTLTLAELAMFRLSRKVIDRNAEQEKAKKEQQSKEQVVKVCKKSQGKEKE